MAVGHSYLCSFFKMHGHSEGMRFKQAILPLSAGGFDPGMKLTLLLVTT